MNYLFLEKKTEVVIFFLFKISGFNFCPLSYVTPVIIVIIYEKWEIIKIRNIISTSKTNFSFIQGNLELVIKTFDKISMDSYPVYSGISTKILINSLKELAPILVKNFNQFIKSGIIPSE